MLSIRKFNGGGGVRIIFFSYRVGHREFRDLMGKTETLNGPHCMKNNNTVITHKTPILVQ